MSENQLRFLVTATQCLTDCGMAVKVLCILINITVFGSVVP